MQGCQVLVTLTSLAGFFPHCYQNFKIKLTLVDCSEGVQNMSLVAVEC